MAITTSAVLIDSVAEWLMMQALGDTNLEDLMSGCCDRLAAAGMPLARANLSVSVLHPLYSAMGFTWRRGEALERERHRRLRPGEADRFLESPYYFLLSHDLDHMRRRLDSGCAIDFPIFSELRAAGLTDYLSFVSKFERGPGQGLLGSWATDSPEGFSEFDITSLLRIETRLAVAARMAVQRGIMRNALTTYLGANAGARVLDGQIQRGDGETIKAAIVIGDMRNSTVLADTLGRQGYIELLNTFFDGAASAFADAGGEILSFMGDAFLAIFPAGETSKSRKVACQQAFAAALEAVHRMQEIHGERAATGRTEIGYGLGLHIGSVMFGNVGLTDRLTFSVFGAAVNEAARLEALTKECRIHIAASAEFRSRSGGHWRELGEHALRGFSSPMTIYTPSMDEKRPRTPINRQARDPGHSDAENLMLLNRSKSSK